MGIKQQDWQQDKENFAKGVFPENFTQRLWKRKRGCHSSFLLYVSLPPAPILPSLYLPWCYIFTRTLAIEAELSKPWRKSCNSKVCYTVLKVDLGISVDFCQYLLIADVAISQVTLFTALLLLLHPCGIDQRIPIMQNRCRDGFLCNVCHCNCLLFVMSHKVSPP